MSMLFSGPKAPSPPPPPPNPPTLANPSIAETGLAERSRLSNAEGAGFNGTDLTGPQGVQSTSTTKTQLGG